VPTQTKAPLAASSTDLKAKLPVRKFCDNTSRRRTEEYDLLIMRSFRHDREGRGQFRAIYPFSNLKVKVKLSLCSMSLALCHEGVWGSGCIDPYFLYLGTGWRCVVSFTPRPLYPGYPLDRRFSGPQSRSGRFGEEKIVDPTGTQNPTPQPSSP
jgi:hypothetical protein